MADPLQAARREGYEAQERVVRCPQCIGSGRALEFGPTSGKVVPCPRCAGAGKVREEP